MIPHWLFPLLLACSVQRASALASAPSSDYIFGQEAAGRTVSRHGRSVAAEIDEAAVVGLHGQAPVVTAAPVVTSVREQTVFGGFMLRTIAPGRFVRNGVVQAALEGAVKLVGANPSPEVPLLKVVGSSASFGVLEGFEDFVRVDFQITLGSARQRQAFIAAVAPQRAQKLAQSIDERVPAPFKGSCKLPESSGFQETTRASGKLLIESLPAPLSVAQSTDWQEALAMAISEEARVNRLEVGLMTAVQSSSSVSVDFWLTTGSAAEREAAIRRVESQSSAVVSNAQGFMASWALLKQLDNGFSVYGRFALEVPSPQDFVTNGAVQGAVQKSVALVAANPSAEVSAAKLSVLDASVKLSTAADVAWVTFQVAFNRIKDRQIFVWDTAINASQRLADVVRSQVPAPFKGRCLLPGWQKSQAVAGTPGLGRFYGIVRLRVSSQQVASSDPEVAEAMAMAISDMTSVPLSQVGVLLQPAIRANVKVTFWVASANQTFRQVAPTAVMAAGREFARKSLVYLNDLRPTSKDPDGLLQGSFTLGVGHAPTFARNRLVRGWLRWAIFKVASDPSAKVLSLGVQSNLWESAVQAVRVDFQVELGSKAARQAFAEQLAMDGGQKFVDTLTKHMPVQLAGLAELPLGSPTKAIDMTLRPKLDKPYGTLLLNVFNPELFVRDVGMREAVAATIARVAAMPRLQVGFTMTAESASIVAINFWVVSSNLAVRQAAVARVEQEWRNRHLERKIGEGTESYLSQTYTACGGTMACCPTPGAEYRCS